MGDDYTNGYLSGMKIKKVKEYVPEVVNGIIQAIQVSFLDYELSASFPSLLGPQLTASSGNCRPCTRKGAEYF